MSRAIDGISPGRVAASSPDPHAHSRSRKRKADTTFDHEGSARTYSSAEVHCMAQAFSAKLETAQEGEGARRGHLGSVDCSRVLSEAFALQQCASKPGFCLSHAVEAITARCQQTLPASSNKPATWPYSQPAKQQLCCSITAQLETIHSSPIWAHQLEVVSSPVPCFQQYNKTSAAPTAAATNVQPSDTCIAPVLVSDSKASELSGRTLSDVPAEEGKIVVTTIHGTGPKQAASAEALMLPDAGALKHELPACADDCWQRCLSTAVPSASGRLAPCYGKVNFGSVQSVKAVDTCASAKLPSSADVAMATAYVEIATKAKKESTQAAVCLTSCGPCGSHSSQHCSRKSHSSQAASADSLHTHSNRQPLEQPDSSKMQHASTMVDTSSWEGLHKLLASMQEPSCDAPCRSIEQINDDYRSSPNYRRQSGYF